MKMLLIGFYDYPYGCTCYELEGGALTRVDLSDETFRLINDYSCPWYTEEYTEEERKEIEDLFNKYERIIVCEDGAYQVLKWKEEESL
jgi:hypothetical protein